MEFKGRRYDTGKSFAVDVQNGAIALVRPTDEQDDLPILAPGFFDIQINGGLGVEFSSADLTPEQVVTVCRKVLREGVFRFCPTVTTNAPEVLRHSVRTIAETVKKYPEYRNLLAGIHLEGPFISRSDGSRGAHPLQYCCEYDSKLLDDLIELGDGLVRVLTLSPEYEGANEFIKKAVEKGLLVAIGHTNATPIQISAAVEAGARLSTHLGNGTSHLLEKAGNYCFAQVTDDRLNASIICDGFHLMPMLLRIFARTKGLDRIVMISDQASVAGLEPGKYNTNLCNLQIMPNQKIVLSGDRHLLAGAFHSLSRGIANLTAVANEPFDRIYDLAVKNPARLMKTSLFSNTDNADFLTVGSPADFLLFRHIPSTFGPLGIADSENFIPGGFQFEKIVYRGEVLQ